MILTIKSSEQHKVYDNKKVNIKGAINPLSKSCEINHNVNYIYPLVRMSLSALLFCFVALTPFILNQVYMIGYETHEYISYLLSIIFSSVGLYIIRNKGLRPHGVLLFVWFSFLALNQLRLGEIQEIRTPDMTLLLFSPLISVIMLAPVYSKDNESTVSARGGQISRIVTLMLYTFIVLKIYLISTCGTRLYDVISSGNLLDGGEYQIAGISGLTYLFQWTSLIFIEKLSKKNQKIVVIVCTIFSALDYKRGDFVRYIIFYYFYKNYRTYAFKGINLSKTIKIIAIILTFMILFAWSGEVRENVRGGIDIGRMIDSRIHNNVFNWFYIYVAMPFDVLMLQYHKLDVNNQFEFITQMVTAIWDKQPLLDAGEILSETSIRGVNAATFLAIIIHLSGSGFIFDLIAYTLIFTVAFKIAYSTNSRGLYAFLMLLLVLFPFGNYLAEPFFIITLLFCLLILFLDYTIKKLVLKRNYKL